MRAIAAATAGSICLEEAMKTYGCRSSFLFLFSWLCVTAYGLSSEARIQLDAYIEERTIENSRSCLFGSQDVGEPVIVAAAATTGSKQAQGGSRQGSRAKSSICHFLDMSMSSTFSTTLCISMPLSFLGFLAYTNCSEVKTLHWSNR